MALNPKQARFVSEYLIDLNGTQAAIRAGYSPKTACSQGERLLRNASVRQAVAKGTSKQLEKADLSATRVLEELRRLSFSDVRALFDEQGNLRPLHELTPEQSAAIAGIDVVRRNISGGDGHTDTVVKVRTWDKTRSLEMLAKHFALLTDVVAIKDADRLLERLASGRERAKK